MSLTLTTISVPQLLKRPDGISSPNDLYIEGSNATSGLGGSINISSSMISPTTTRGTVNISNKGANSSNITFSGKVNSGFIPTTTISQLNTSTWTSSVPTTVSQWNSITFSDNLMLAVGNSTSSLNGSIMKSTDGVTWTSSIPTTNSNWKSVTYGDNQFVAVGYSDLVGGSIMKSNNGVTWTSSGSLIANLNSVIYSPDLLSYIAAGLSSFSQIGNKLVGVTTSGTTSQQGRSVAISGDGNTLAIGGSNDNVGIGSTWVFIRSGNNWVQQGNKLVGTGFESSPLQGFSVSLSYDGNTLAVGGYADSNDGGITLTGATWIFTRSGSSWTQQSRLIGTGNTYDSYQGQSVSLSNDGNTLVVGGPQDDSLIGATWIFTRSAGVWTQQGNKLVGTGYTFVSNVQQGRSIAISGDGNTVAVGGNGDNSNIGAVWIFTRSGITWSQQGNKLVGSGNSGNSGQGRSNSISDDGNTLVVGGQSDNSSRGAVWIFTRSGSTWTQQGSKLVGTGFSGTTAQGSSVSLSGDGNIVSIGGTTDNSNRGATWIFTRSGNNWSQFGNKLDGTGFSGSSSQGTSISLSSNGATFAVGGINDNSSIGATWIFESQSIIKSSDAVSWATVPSPYGNQQSITWSPEKSLLVSVSNNDTVLLSNNSITWTTTSATTTSNWKSVIYAQDKFVAVGSNTSLNGCVMTSSDGLTWTSRVPTTPSSWNSVTYSEELNLFVASSSSVLREFALMSSTDAITWSTLNATTTSSWNSVIWNKNLSQFVAVGSSTSYNGTIMESFTSNIKSTSIGTNATSTVNIYGNVNITGDVSLGNYSNTIDLGNVSTNTLNIDDNIQITDYYGYVNNSSLSSVIDSSLGSWNGYNRVYFNTLGMTSRISNIVWSEKLGLYCVRAYDRILISSDGVNWRSVIRDSMLINFSFSKNILLWNNELSIFYLVTYDKSFISSNGINWTSNILPTNSFNYSIEWSKDLSIYLYMAYEQSFISYDGITWISNTVGFRFISDIIWVPKLKLFFGCSLQNIRGVISYNGINFTTLGSSVLDQNNQVIWVDELEKLYSISYTTRTISISDNAFTWTTYTLPNTFQNITWSPQLSIFLGEGDPFIYKSTDGITWVTNIQITTSYDTGDDYSASELFWNPNLSQFVFLQIPEGVNSNNLNAYLSNNSFPGFNKEVTITSNNINIYSKNLELGNDSNNVIVNSNNLTIGPTNNITMDELITEDGLISNTLFNAGNTPLATLQNLSFTSWTTTVSINSNSMVWSPEQGIFVSVGNDYSSVSSDGVTWTSESIPVGTWSTVEFGNDVFIAGNNSQNLSWSTVAIGGSKSWLEGTYGDKFVSVGDGGAIVSNDGITWTSNNLADTTSNCIGIDWSPTLGLYVAVSYNNCRIQTSPDGLTWTSRSSLGNSNTDVVWADLLGKFYVVNNSPGNTIEYSSDGITWISLSTGITSNWQAICYGKNLLVAVARDSGNNNPVMTSYDGLTWTTRSANTGANWNSVCYSPELDLFVAVSIASGADTPNCMSSVDAVTWTTRNFPSYGYVDVVWASGFQIFFAAGNNGVNGNSSISYDSITWTTIMIPDIFESDTNGYSIAYSQSLNRFVAVSELSKAVYSNNFNSLIKSSNGLNWTTLIQNIVFNDICYSEELKLFVAISSSRPFLSENGSTWTTVAQNITGNSVCWSNELSIFCCVGSGVYTSANGINWTSRTISSTTLNSVTYSEELNLFCAVGVNQIFTSPNGSTWTTRLTDSNTYQTVVWSPQLQSFLVTGNFTVSSSDGITWTSRVIQTPINSRSLAWSPSLGRYCVQNQTTNNILLSNNVYNNTITNIGTINNTNVNIYGRNVNIGNDSNAVTLGEYSDSLIINNAIINGESNFIGNTSINNKEITLNKNETAVDNIPYNWQISPTTYSSTSSISSWRISWSNRLGLFCMVARSSSGDTNTTNPTILTSPDGLNWTTMLNFRSFTGTCYSDSLGLFCCVANTNTVLDNVALSSDGINWVTYNSPMKILKDVCWSPDLNLFCAVSGDFTSSGGMISSNGINWSTVVIPQLANNGWSSICWSSELGIFVVVNESVTNNFIAKSSNGVNWTNVIVPVYGGGWNTIVWSPELGLFCAVSTSSSILLKSYDAINWFTSSSPGTANRSINWNPQLSQFLIGTNDTTNNIMISSDSINWTTISSGLTDTLCNGIAWSPSLSRYSIAMYKTSGTSVRSIATTLPDNRTLKIGTKGLATTNILGKNLNISNNSNDLVISSNNINIGPANEYTAFKGEVLQNNNNEFNNSKTRIGNNESTDVQTSAIGNWTLSYVTNSLWRGIAYSPKLNIFCAVTTGSESGNFQPYISRDGISWTSSNIATTSTEVAGFNPFSIIWCKELEMFVCSGNNPMIIRSYNGIFWFTNTNIISIANYAICWAAELGLFCTVSRRKDQSAMIWTSSDSISWTSRICPSSNSFTANDNGLYGVCFSNELCLFVAVNRDYTTGFCHLSNDGITWRTNPFPNIACERTVIWSSELNMFVVGGQIDTTFTTATIFSSFNGTVWTSRYTNAYTPSNVVYSSELQLFIFTTFGSNFQYYSDNGINWSTFSIIPVSISPTTRSFFNIAWNPTLSIFCAISNQNSDNLTSAISNANFVGITKDVTIGTKALTTTNINSNSITISGGDINIGRYANSVYLGPVQISRKYFYQANCAIAPSADNRPIIFSNNIYSNVPVWNTAGTPTYGGYSVYSVTQGGRFYPPIPSLYQVTMNTYGINPYTSAITKNGSVIQTYITNAQSNITSNKTLIYLGSTDFIETIVVSGFANFTTRSGYISIMRLYS